MSDWNHDKARNTYNMDHWGAGYFEISEAGHLIARPAGTDGPAGGVDLYTLSDALHAAGLSLPVLVRFSGILRHRIDALHAAFDGARTAHDYNGAYTLVYPIKVNQQRSVVDEIISHGGEGVGLEAGSKPELLAVLARSRANGVIVCNGYMDREYLRLALIGQALGHRVYIVIEKFSELEMLLAESAAMGIRPLVGIRVRLASLGVGKWQNTGGEKSKFGLSASEVLRVIARLREAQMLDTLKMLHFHMGSQISSLRDIAGGMDEGARLYAALHALGAEIDCVNVGGGLGVDYEGTRSRSPCSLNYTLDDYARCIVSALRKVCDEKALPHPHIISESGRALTAHHAMLITNVLEVEQLSASQQLTPVDSNAHPILKNLWRYYDGATTQTVVETEFDASQALAEVHGLFSQGKLTLGERAHAEQLYFAISHKLRDLLRPTVRAHRELLDTLNERLADKYFCNFSLFQSAPDSWAIEQVFPVMPLNRLDERPTRRGVIEDITCDSDGRIDRFADGEGVETSLPLHAPKDGETYLLGIFMLGAYQEILGDIHNLFGDTDSVHVELAPDGATTLAEIKKGDGVDAVLRAVNFDPESLLADFEAKINVVALDDSARVAYRAALSEGLKGYTYLED